MATGGFSKGFSTGFASGATLYWVGGAGGDTTNWHNANNWSLTSGGAGGAGVPTILDDVNFDSGSTGFNCTLTAAGSCNTLTQTVAWNKVLSLGGFSLTSAGTVSFAGTTGSGLTMNGGFTMTGDGNFTIASSVATRSYASTLTFQGTGSINISSSTDSTFFTITTLAYSGKTTTFSGGANVQWTNTIVLGIPGAAGTLTVSAALTISPIATCTVLTTNTGYTINGAFNISISPSTCAADVVLTLTAVTISTGQILLLRGTNWAGAGSTSCTYSLSGALSVGGLTLQHERSSTTYVFNTNNNNITISGASAYIQGIATGATSATFNASYGSSTVSIGSGGYSGSTNNAAGTYSINLNTSTWTCVGNWTYGSNHTYTVGTSSVTMNGTSSTAIASNGKSFYTLTFTKSSNAVNITLSDALSCNSLTHSTSTSGNFNSGGFAITSATTISLSSTGTLNISSSTITITGDGNFSVASGVGTFTVTSCALVLQGTGNLAVSKATVSPGFLSVTCSASGKVTTATAAFYVQTLTTSSGTFAINASGITLTLSTGTPWVMSGTTVTSNSGGNIFAYEPSATGGTISLVSGNWQVFATNRFELKCLSTSSRSCTYNMTGDLRVASMVIMHYAGTAGFTLTFNTNDFVINCDSGMTTDNATTSSAANVIINCGASAISAPQIGANKGSGTHTINMNTSTWTFPNTSGANIGGWNLITINPGTSTFNFTGANATSVNIGTNSLYTVSVNKSAAWNLTGAFACNTLSKLGSGTLNTSTFALTAVSTINIGGTGPTTLGAGVTMTGDGDFIIASTTGTLTTTACALNLQGTGNLQTDKAMTGSGVFLSMTCAASGKITTFTGTQQLGVTTLTLGAGTFVRAGDLDMTGVTTFSPNASNTVKINGTTSRTVTSASKTFAILFIDINHATNFCYFADVMSCTRFRPQPNTRIKWKNSVTHTPGVAPYISGDWNGTLGNLVEFFSDSPGTRYTLANPATM